MLGHEQGSYQMIMYSANDLLPRHIFGRWSYVSGEDMNIMAKSMQGKSKLSDMKSHTAHSSRVCCLQRENCYMHISQKG